MRRGNVTAPRGRLIVAQDVILGRIKKNDLVPKGRLRISQDVILGALSCTQMFWRQPTKQFRVRGVQ